MPRRRPAPSLLWLLVLGAGSGCGGERASPGPVDVTLSRPSAPAITAQPQLLVVPKRAVAPREPLEPCIERLRADPAPASPSDPGVELYGRALAAERAGDMNGGRKLYFELIDRHKGSALTPASYFAFAELFRLEARQDPSKLPFAEMAYQEVVKYPDNSLSQVALLRVGEVFFAQGKLEEALANHARAITGAASGPCADAAVGAALDGIVPVFAKAGDPRKAPTFFATLRPRGSSPDRERTAELSLRLVRAYIDARQRADASATLQALAGHSDASTDALCTDGHRLAVETGDLAAERAVASRCTPP